MESGCSRSVASLGGFLFGFDTGVIGGALPYIIDDPIFEPYLGSVGLSSMVQGLIVSSTLLGGGVGSILGGMLADMKGRFTCMLLMDGLFILGGILMSACMNIPTLVVGRFIIGLAIGGTAAVTPVYLAEQAPAAKRASYVSLQIVYVTFGQLVAYIVNSMLGGHWRVMLGLCLVPAVAQTLGLVFLVDDTPCSHPSTEYYQILQHMNIPLNIRKQLRLGVMLQVLQQACGINTIMYFLPILLQSAGIEHYVQWSIVPASCNVLGTLIGKSTLDVYGRRKVLISSMAGITIVLFGLSVAFGMAFKDSPVLDGTCPNNRKTCSSCISSGCIYCTLSQGSQGGSCLASTVPGDALVQCQDSLQSDNVRVFEHGCPTTIFYSMLIFALTCLYLLAFSPGLGIVPWVVGSEIFHEDFRGICMGISSVANWMTNFIITQGFMWSIRVVGPQMTFVGIALTSLCGMVWVSQNLPETNGLDLSEIQYIFSS